MISKLKSLIFKDKKIEGLEKYSGLSDFFLHASHDEKMRVISEASRRASKDQLKILKEANFKMNPR